MKGSRRRECIQYFLLFCNFTQIYCGKKTKHNLLYGQSLNIYLDLASFNVIEVQVMENFTVNSSSGKSPGMSGQNRRENFWAN